MSSTRPSIDVRELMSRSVLAEAAAYVGAAVAAAAASLIVARTSPGTGGDVAVSVLFVAVLLGVGFAVGEETRSAARIRTVLWLGAVLSWFSLVAVIIFEAARMTSRAGAIVASILAAFGAFAVWWLSRRSLQQIAAYATIAAIVASVAFPVPSLFGFDTTTVGILLWLLGIVWIVLAARGLVAPRRTGLVLGAVTAVVTPVYLLRVSAASAADILGFLTALVLLAGGAWISDRAVEGIGIVGLFTTSGSFVVAHFGSSTAAAAVALVVGLALLAACVALIRAAPTSGPAGLPPSGPEGLPPSGPGGASGPGPAMPSPRPGTPTWLPPVGPAGPPAAPPPAPHGESPNPPGPTG